MGEDQREKGSDQKKLKKVSFFKLFSFADRFDVLLMLFGSVGAIANGMTRPIMTVIFGEVVSSFATARPSEINHLVSQVCVKYVILAVGAGIASFLEMCCWMITGERQATRIRELYLQTILRQDIAFFDTQTTTGEVIGRMSGDTVTIQNAMGEKVGKFIQLVSTFFGGMIIAFLKGWHLAIVVSSCVPALLVAGGITSRGIAKMMSQGQAAYGEAGSIVEQVVGAIRTVASFTGEKEARRKYDEKLQTAYRATYQQGLVSGLGLGSMLCLTFGSYALATWYGSKMILDMGYDGGKVINIIMAMVTSGICIGQISPCLSAFGAGQAAAYKMIKTIQRKPKIDSYDKRGLALTDIKGEIELRNIHFRYPARPDVQIFGGFSLHIPSGKIAALVGQSGSGKSTVIGLLERFYDPDVGEVLIDGIDLKKFRIRWIREKIGLVSQEPILFTTSIRENIAFGKEKASDEEIRTAIELANASNFINKLPQGLDTMVGEHGTQLSGGQKQRIAIARAILKNPRILLLDEATSALDAESERVVQNALDQVMSNRTTVVIAHRLTTIRNADIIAVVHHGKLLEQGKHDDLVKDPEGAYSKLVQMQSGTNRDEHARTIETHNMDTIPSDIFRRSPRTSGRRSTSSRRSFGTAQENDGDDLSIKNDKKMKKNVSLKRLAYLNKPEFPVLFLGAIAASVQGLMFPMFGLAMSSAIRIFYEPPHELRRDGRFWSLIFLSIGVGTLVIMPVQNFFFGVAGGKLIRRIRSLTFEKIVHREISWFDKPENSSGAIGARLAMDASTVRSLVGDSLALVVQNISTIACGVVIAFTANLRLALIVLVALPFVSMEAFTHMKFLKGFSANANAMYEEASQVASDAVGNIRTVASFCAEEKVMERYRRKCNGPMKQGIKTGIISGIAFGISSFALYCASSFCFYMGSVFQQHGKATFSEVFKVFFALTMTMNGVSRTFASCPDMAKARDSSASIFDILDTKSEIDSSSDAGTTLDNVKGDIELRHVCFKYPTRPNIQIFKDLCLTIPSGKMVALVGESGSGKSSVISLIERFYDPDSGHVYLDGVEIHKLKLSWLRQQLGLVSQEPVLFNDTIRANIGYGKQGGTSEEEIVRAAKASNAHGFISALPQGYDTSVGERGTQLSGGQKQRIAIARAILREPRVLLLDEATSALDAESERVVQDALDQVMVGRTSVVVAHRLSTIKGADVIAVLKNGVIVEEGTHDELSNVRDGLYASLVALHTSSD